jgi:hypothetical protein
MIIFKPYIITALEPPVMGIVLKVAKRNLCYTKLDLSGWSKIIFKPTLFDEMCIKCGIKTVLKIDTNPGVTGIDIDSPGIYGCLEIIRIKVSTVIRKV